MIVVEGPDGAGKSTLVKHLSEKFGLEIGERGVANRDFLYKVTRQDTYRALSEAVKGDTPVKIWDRLWISEYVYHGIHPGRPCEFTESDTVLIRNLMNALACPFIVCLPPYQTVAENVAAVHQMEGVKGAVKEIYGHYVDGELPWPLTTFHYDYTTDPGSIFAVENIVSHYLQRRKEREVWS